MAHKARLDASGFCVANALYDPLFVMSANGKVAADAGALGDAERRLHGVDDCTAPGHQLQQR